MGTVKSVRFSEKTENMFNVVKSYMKERNANITDTEIISNGIEIQYEGISNDLNNYFRTKMLENISENENTKNVFEQAANMLEVLSISDGSVLEDEFWCFLLVNSDGASVFSTNEDGKVNQTKQYIKIYETLEKTFGEDDLSDAVMELNSVYRENFKN